MLTTFVIPAYRNMLSNAAMWLDKAVDQRGAEAAEAMLSARLAPDMFPLASQFRFACVQALEALAYLQLGTLDPLASQILAEGQQAGERPGSVADIMRHIQQTIALLDGEAAKAPRFDPDLAIEHKLPMGLIFDMSAQEFGRDWSVPQFYFHINMAYAILRSQGVEIGKADYIGHALGYLRPSSAPASA